MSESWAYKQPTEIDFGIGMRRSICSAVSRFGTNPVFVTDSILRDMEMTAEVVGMLGSSTPIFSDIEPNPTVASVDKLSELIRANHHDVVVAMGGGSSLDCAKAACSVAVQGGIAREYHSEGRAFDSNHLPLIAVPTTAGTGSEVTPIAVLDDSEKGIKTPIAHSNFFPSLAIVDPELTVTMPRSVTASTGFDALSHAIEGYWSKNNQPICDLMALKAVNLVFTHLRNALDTPGNVHAREGMSMAALLGGLAFQLPKNAAVHACSFPLSSKYHLPHGTACAMTLDHFIRFNVSAMGVRGKALAVAAGFPDMESLADAVSEFKTYAGLPSSLREIGVREDELDELVQSSFHALMKNNPRDVTPADLHALYLEMM